MRVVLQRVARAAVTVDGVVVGEIGRGFLLLVGVGAQDGPGEGADGAGDVAWLADKISTLRLFQDAEGKMNLALTEVDGEVLVVPQFTLFGDVRKGRRPSWAGAADPELARPRVEALAQALEARGLRVGRGVFGAHMEVDLRNDGPVTLLLDTAAR
jgi:D-tyrosyl-tRNA(Tyr) deacylase